MTLRVDDDPTLGTVQILLAELEPLLAGCTLLCLDVCFLLKVVLLPSWVVLEKR